MSKREIVTSLLRAGVSIPAIMEQVGCHRATVYRAKKLLAVGGDPAPKNLGGRPRTATTPAATAAVLRAVRRNPTRSMASIATSLGKSPTTVRRIVRLAGYKSLRKRKVQLLSARTRNRRLERSKGLLSNLKSAPAGRILFFSDEKTFSVDPYRNRQNDRWIRLGGPDSAVSAEVQSGDRYHTTTKHPAAAMFLGVVASTGEVGPKIWFPQGYRLNADQYIKVLKSKILPWMRSVAVEHGPRGQPAKFCFQQDGAPAHTAKKTVKFLKDQGIEFWTPVMWPPSSPDMAPLDYGVWPLLTAAACRTRAVNVGTMKRRVNNAWRNLEPSKIRSICAGFRRRLELCAAAKGSIFEA